MQRFSKFFCAGVIAAMAVAVSTPSFAQLIAADSFNIADYPATTGLNEQNPTITPGWNGDNAWTVGTANLQSDIGGSLNNGSVTYDDSSDGKARYVASSFDFYRAGFRALDSYTPDDTYYMSVLFNTGGNFSNGTGGDYATVGFTNFFDQAAFNNGSGSSNVFGLLFGMTGTPVSGDVGTKDLIIRARDASGDLADNVILADAASNTTFLIVSKLSVDASGSTDVVDWWIDPTDLSSDANMTSSAFAAGSINTFAMDQVDRIDRFFAVSDTWSSSFFWDEPRLGYDLASVSGVTGSVENADFNGDESVDGSDFLIWQEGFNLGTTLAEGDADGDGDVDDADLAIWNSQFVGASQVAAATSVPEPASILVALLAVCPIAIRKRR